MDGRERSLSTKGLPQAKKSKTEYEEFLKDNQEVLESVAKSKSRFVTYKEPKDMYQNAINIIGVYLFQLDDLENYKSSFFRRGSSSKARRLQERE